MIFATAAGLLAASVQVVSEGSGLGLERSKTSIKKFQTFWQPKGDYRRRESRRAASYSSLTGELKNTLTSKECDPNSSSVDVGILSCGNAMYCAESEASDLGGFCASRHRTSTSRRIQDEYYIPEGALCDQTSPYYQYYNCTCSEFDLVSRTGTVTCDRPGSPSCLAACNETCYESIVFYTIETDGNVTLGYSYNFYSPYTQKVSYLYEDEGSKCSLVFNGMTCNSCTPQVYSGSTCLNETYCFNYTIPCVAFNCSNTEGGHSGNTCEPLSYVHTITDACFDFFVCPICPNATMTEVDGIVQLPNGEEAECGYLQYIANNGIILEEECKALQPFTKIPCGCLSGNATAAPTAAGVFECNICGDGSEITNPDALVTLPQQPEMTCATLQEGGNAGAISPFNCALITQFVADPCGCQPIMPTQSPAPTVTPSESPSTTMPTAGGSGVATVVRAGVVASVSLALVLWM